MLTCCEATVLPSSCAVTVTLHALISSFSARKRGEKMRSAVSSTALSKGTSARVSYGTSRPSSLAMEMISVTASVKSLRTCSVTGVARK